MAAMPAPTLIRLAVLAWLAAAIARIGLFVVDAAPAGDELSGPALGLGVALCVAVAAWLWRRPGRGSTLAATILGTYALTGLFYLPLIGPQPWFLVLVLTGLAAFALSLAAAIAVRRGGGAAGDDPGR
jgi:hypothetical protein